MILFLMSHYTTLGWRGEPTALYGERRLSRLQKSVILIIAEMISLLIHLLITRILFIFDQKYNYISKVLDGCCDIAVFTINVIFKK